MIYDNFYVLSKNKNIFLIHLKIVILTVIKVRSILHDRVIVM